MPYSLTAAPAAAEAFAGYGWGFSDNEDGPSLVLGSTETTEDYVFLLSCSNADKSAEMTVYVAIEGAKIGQPVTIELTRDGAEAHQGQGHDDEMASSSPKPDSVSRSSPSLMVKGR